MSLEGKTAVVTGGATGIGWGIASALATAGCRVVIAGRREDKLQAAADSFAGEPAIEYKVLDVANREQVNEVFAWAHHRLGKIDILVNSAGTNIVKRKMVDMAPEDWDRVMAINATGAYNCMYAVLDDMRKRGDGLIINISSIAGKRASALGGIAYSASKFAMTALGTCVGNEDAANGVRVTNVYPGEVNTPILDNRPNPVSDEHKARILQPEDFGQLAVAICQLPPRAHVPEMILKPTCQEYQ